MGFKPSTAASSDDSRSVSARATPRPKGETVKRHAAKRAGKQAAKRSLKTFETSKQSAGTDRKSSEKPSANGAKDGATWKTPKVDPELYDVARASARIACSLMSVQDEAKRKELFSVLYATQNYYAIGLNLATIALWKDDEERLRAWQLKNPGKVPKAKDWPRPVASSQGLNIYQRIREQVPMLGSAIAAQAANQAFQKWSTDRYDALVFQKKHPPHFRSDHPIWIPKQAFRLTQKSLDLYEISFSLSPGRHPGGAQFRIPLVARDSYMRERLSNLCSETWRRRAVTLQQDRRHKSKWYFRISYSRLVQKKQVGQSAAINRGVINFLVGVTEDHDTWKYSGADIEAHLSRTQGRRRRIQNSINGTARVGRGRKRALKAIDRLSGATARWRDTKNQVIAARFAQWCHKRSVRRVFLDDLKGIRQSVDSVRVHTWRYDDLGARITACLEEYGIEVKANKSAFISQTCPECGNVDEEQVDKKTRRFKCKACGFTLGDIDEVAGRNNLARGLAAD